MTTPHPASFMPATLNDQIAGILRINVRPELLWKIGPYASLGGDLGLDSLSLTHLAVAFEDYFGIDISDADVATWNKPGDITVTIMTKLAINAAALDDAYPETPLPDQQLANGSACS